MARRNSNTAAKIEEAVVETTQAGAVESTKNFPTTEQLIEQGHTTKSARIRALHALGMPIGDIARQETGGLYQHAYNVIKKPLKRPIAEQPAVMEAQEAQEEAPVTEDNASQEA